MTHIELIILIKSIKPANLDALDMLEALIRGDLSNDMLVDKGTEIEAAQVELERIAGDSRKVTERCRYLKAIPSKRIPAGF